MASLSIVVKKLTLHVTQKTEDNDCSWFWTAKIGQQNMPQITSFQQQQMESKYSFWGNVSCRQFCSLTYPANTGKQEGSITRDRVPSVVHLEMNTGQFSELGISELGLCSVLDNVLVVFGLLVPTEDAFLYNK